MHEVERLFDLSYQTKWQWALRSPPDVFAVCAYFAKVSGCYREYAHASPALREAVTNAVDEGEAWRRALDDKANPEIGDLPVGVRDAWSYIKGAKNQSLDALQADPKFVRSCLYLIVACDEACAGIGIPGGSGQSYFELISEIRINSGTLCRAIPSDSLRVLPKQHTPQSGFNIRSLTHHLALCTASEVRPVWTQIPFQRGRRPDRVAYNVLLAPWPLNMESSDLKPASRESSSDRFGYFDFAPQRANAIKPVKDWVSKMLAQAKKMGQPIDLVVFPECALTNKQWDAVVSVAATYGASLVAGVRGGTTNGFAENSLRFKVPHAWQNVDPQHKHHRWQISESQINNYGLGATLDRRKVWWENIRIKDRTLNFFAVRPELVVCPLICEDLARQDPVAELVRSVGPNLVIALLMDGPQLADRWSARYATVLADDPGCSVLTITSLGMVNQSRPGNGPRSRVIASWKDAFGKFVPLELDAGCSAMILNLQFRDQNECSIDGRRDGGVATTPVLCGIHSLAE